MTRAGVLRLDRNERLFPAPGMAGLLGRIPPEALNRYPDARAFETVLARMRGIARDRVLATAGGDDGIDRICRVAVGPRREMVVARPTFEMYPHFAELAGGRVVEVAADGDPAPASALLGAVTERTGAVVVVSPHNPLGAAVPTTRLLSLAADLPPDVWLVVDLAYVEFADADPTAALLERPNVVVLRTLSKAWGLAGLRVGCVIGPAAVVARLREAGAPFPIASPSLWLAERAVELGSRLTAPYVARVREEREILSRVLRGLGAEPRPSDANFVLARFDDAFGVADRLERAGLRVRRFRHSPEDLRITLPGDPEAFERLVDALGTAVGTTMEETCQ